MMFSSVTGSADSLDLNLLLNRGQTEALVQEEIVDVTSMTTEEYVKYYFADAPVMVDIARCESQFRHTNQYGEVLRGMAVDTDRGVMQINEYYHLETSKKLGIDIYTLEGNLAYARYLYETQGVRPWKPSAKCWGDEHPEYYEIAMR